MIHLKFIDFLEYILILLIILEFNTPYMEFDPIKNAVHLIFIVTLYVLNLSKQKKTKIDFLILALLFGSVLPAIHVASDNFFKFFRLYIVCLPMLVCYLTALFREGTNKVCTLLLKYSNIVILLAIISIFFWLCGSVFEKIPYTLLIPNSWTGEEKLIPTYYGIYFETQETTATASQVSSIIRNSGIFNEAPMYNMILCVAVAVEVFIRPLISIKRVIILIASIFSTISTTGIIFLILLFVGKLCIRMNSRQYFVFILGLPIISLFVFFSVSMLLDNKKETGGLSYNSRSMDIERCIDVGLENPLLGVGLYHKESGAFRYGFSNSTFTVFAHGGLYVLSLYLISMLLMPFLCYKKTKNIGILCLMYSYFILFTFTISQYKYLTMLFIAIGLSYWNVTFRYKKLNLCHKHLLETNKTCF